MCIRDRTSCALECYSCSGNACANGTITEATPKKTCAEGQKCGSSSGLTNGTLNFIIRACVDDDKVNCQNMCTKPTSKGYIDCFACCGTNLCNTGIPSAPDNNSGSTALSPPFVSLLLASALLCLAIQLLS